MNLAFFGFLLKVSYIIPFFVFYVLFKRYNHVVKNESYKKLRAGLSLLCLGIASIFLIQIIGFFRLLDDYSINFLLFMQIISNSLLVASYIILFQGVKGFDEDVIKLNIKPYLLLVIFFLLITSLIITDNLYLIFSIVTYCLAIFILVLCLLGISNLLKKLHIKFYYLPVIGVFFLIIDPILYFRIYSEAMISVDTIGLLADIINSPESMFFYYRSIAYASASIAMVFVLLPVFSLLIKVLTRRVITFDDDDSTPERVIKKLTIKMQKIVGKVAFTIIHLASKDFEKRFKKVDYNQNLDIKNLSAKDKKEFLKMVIKKYYRIIGKPVTDNVLKKICDNELRDVIIDCSEVKSTSAV